VPGFAERPLWVENGHRFSDDCGVLLDLIAPTVSMSDLPAAGAFARFEPFLKGVFSQWHRTPFTLHSRHFATAEQWMMFGKAELFGDAPRAAAILEAEHPAQQKRLGQHVAGFDQETWDRWKVEIVMQGNRAKFRQNPGAARQLLATGDAMLVEANTRDWVWGAGVSADDPRLQHPSQWPGVNLLGRILVRVREELRTPWV
jgi:ribA/ribD-fused uncharacterized protein